MNGRTRYVRHDTEHFAYEAYIAEYNDGGKMDYALFDDANNRIIYVYYSESIYEGLDIISPDQIISKYEFRPINGKVPNGSILD